MAQPRAPGVPDYRHPQGWLTGTGFLKMVSARLSLILTVLGLQVVKIPEKIGFWSVLASQPSFPDRSAEHVHVRR